MDSGNKSSLNNGSKIIEIMNQASLKMLDASFEWEVYEILAEAVTRILPNAMFLVSKLQPDDMNFRIVQSSGFDNYFNAIKMIVGKDPFTLDFPLKNFTPDQIRAYESRKIHHFPDGIYDLATGVLNKTICRAIERLLGIADVFAMSFYVEKKYFGGITLFIPKSIMKSGMMNQETKWAIETVSNQASSVIQRLRDQHDLIRSEKELISNQNRYNKLIESLTDIVWKANKDGTGLTDMNNSFERFYGVNAADFERNPNLWIEFAHPEDRQIVIDSGTTLFNTGSSTAEYRIIRKDGRIIWLSDRKSILYDQSGIPIEMGGIASDITERKLLEEELKIKDYSLDNSPTATGLADISGTIFYVNKAYVELFGFRTKDEIIGKHISAFAYSKQSIAKVIDTIIHGGIYTGEGLIQNQHGSKIPVIISASSVYKDNKQICFMALFVDISERKDFETKLKEKTDQLEILNKSKDKFFSILSHDLRNPFNSILGLTEILSEQYDVFNDAERVEYIRLLNSTANNAFRLLENLLDWARVNQGRIVLVKEKLNINDLIDECLALYSTPITNKNIQILRSTSLDTFLYADRNSVKTIFRNVINNAVKFTHPGGSLTIEVNPKGSRTEVSFKDTGIGMNHDIIENVFKIDVIHTSRGTADEKGTGLGLILCHELAAINGGELSVLSEEGKGSVFTLSLPRE